MTSKILKLRDLNKIQILKILIQDVNSQDPVYRLFQKFI